MAKIKKQNIRKLQKQANGSTTIALPTDVLKELKWRDKQKVVVKKRGSGILIEDWVPPKKAVVKKKTTAKKSVQTKRKATKKAVKKTVPKAKREK